MFKIVHLVKGAWTFLAVIIPATFWLARLDFNGQEARAAILKTDTEVSHMKAKIEDDLLEIKQDLSEIKGELKRIRR